MATLRPFPPDAHIDADGNVVGDVTKFVYGRADEFEPPSTVSNPLARTFTPKSAGDIQREQAANAREMGTAAAVGAAGSALDVAASFIPTAQDTRNEQELANFRGMAQAGQLGLSQDERGALQRALMGPARAALTSARQHEDERQASLGNRSVAAQQASAASSRDAAIKAEMQAGQEIERQNIAERHRQEQQNEERIAYKGEREAQRIAAATNAVNKGASQIGAVLAAQATERAPLDADLLKQAQMKDDRGNPVYPSLADAYAKGGIEGARSEWDRAAKEERQARDPLARLFAPKKRAPAEELEPAAEVQPPPSVGPATATGPTAATTPTGYGTRPGTWGWNYELAKMGR